MTPATLRPRSQQLRFLAAACTWPRGRRADDELLTIASAAAGRRLTALADLDYLTDDQVDRIATQLNRRMACDPVRLTSVERINDYHLEEER